MPVAAASSHFFPKPTPTPASSSSSQRNLRQRRKRSPILSRQQNVPDREAIERAENQCQVFSSNSVLSCYPNSNTSIAQNEWATFVWNSRLPQYAQKNLVDIYLFHGDSNEQILAAHNITNPTNRAGVYTAAFDDTWLGSRGADWNGKNTSFLYYWVITPANEPLGNSYLPQATFTGVQTTYPASVIATMTTGTNNPSASNSNSLGSGSGSGTGTGGGSPTGGGGGPDGTGSVQSSGASSSFPHWAIAVIVVLGFLAIVAICVLAFLILRRLRRKEGADLSHRGSMGSSAPMMAESHANATPSSPLLGAGGGSTSEHHDGVSIISRAHSAGESGLFSGADAAIMADAFREALRKPNFPGGVDEESPEEKERRAAELQLLNRELAEEGRDIRSVASSRGVRVENLSESGETNSPAH